MNYMKVTFIVNNTVGYISFDGGKNSSNVKIYAQEMLGNAWKISKLASHWPCISQCIWLRDGNHG